MMEVLTVIAIIAILAGLALLGFQAMEASASRKRTAMMLSNAASMFAEYDAATALKKQPPYMFVGTTASNAAGYDIFRDTNPGTAAADEPLAAPPGGVEPGDAARTTSQAVLNTAVLMREMERIPAVKNIVAQLPADAFMSVPLPAALGQPASTGRVMLDGWGNPIIFVPRAGLGGVQLGEPTDARNPFVVRSTKVYPRTDNTVTPTPVAPPNARPFFASAGPDGAFSFVDKNNNSTFDQTTDTVGGDDNLYSFEN